ncbi:MAG: T9SS type A sorting domain-containing protein [Bacteroidetes bacterium]|nr:T9SS type A sorting domain-containing protein [Bacteroidota bacterium]MDA1268109.1 T9SS type A sorting domain-containing protein [Bacteroidota bacterium]
MKTDAKLGRLNTTTILGDTDADGDFDAIYTLGARSFSIWNGLTGDQVFDSKNELGKKASEALVYDDATSDDKGTEPKANGYEVFPNPAQNTINISSSLNTHPLIIIYDLNGRAVIQTSLTELDKSIDLSSNSDGVYLMRIIETKKLISVKIIKAN